MHPRSLVALALFVVAPGSACETPLVVAAVDVDNAFAPGTRIALRWFLAGDAGASIDSDSFVDTDGVHHLRVHQVDEQAMSADIDHEAGGQIVLVSDREDGEVVGVTNTFVFAIEEGHADATPGWHVNASVTSDACAATTADCLLECAPPTCFCGDCSDWIDRDLSEPVPLRLGG